ncbi:hypothetical protein HYPSUDRAFT_63648 [Hypholoma sublateritium FD-334 SS-4]|uniref:Glucose receptor Git3 N-terminal domain-containing protein n=1 Tax=Hypholoma sublateritium (strain FD-334 SS-4) TaxID=945553 RepID=A0A0D2MSA5_HYPSF|nr:hypothetical protein HYPSUDRAFT_63648 [Hypholoma sublateritium FD-334 SS-4]
MTTSSSANIAPSTIHYDGSETAGVTLVALTALSSILAIFYLFAVQRPKAKTFKTTHIFGYFMCLLAGNVIQTAGTVIDFEWIARRGAVDGFACSLQGGLKQAGDLSASFWSLIISVHIFLLLFFQIRSNQAAFITVIVVTWSLVLLIVLVGRFAIQKEDLGSYFGISGQWCWISGNYQQERIFLECFFELLTIAISFVLYTLILLRVRGSTVISIGVTGINRSMLEIARKMIWYPVSYTAIMLPMTLIRILQFKYNVPFVLITISGIVLNSMGLVNAILVIYISRAFKRLDKGILPQTSELHREYGGSMDVLRDPPRGSPAFEQEDKHSLDDSLAVRVDLPIVPAGTYVAPDSWKTSSPGGRKY